MGKMLFSAGGTTLCTLVLSAVFAVFCQFPFSSFLMVPGTRNETKKIIDDEGERGVRIRWMKSSFLRLSWPWIISVCFSEGYTVPRCSLLKEKYERIQTFFVHDK